MTAPPLRLVLSPVEPGLRQILVNGVHVGFALDHWDDRDKWAGAWGSRLYNVAGTREHGWAEGPSALRLRDLRAALEQRLAEQGPWWREPGAAG